MNPELLEIALIKIPEPIIHPIGFLDITRNQYNEVVISRIYCFFLTRENNFKIAELFANSLTSIIKEKTGKDIELDDHNCFTEVKTTNGNRIDILLQSSDEKKSIIIENKIFHVLNNDLNDYYDHCKGEMKIGVLLTLNQQNIPNEAKSKFCNITHDEWINKIESIGLPAGLSAKEYIYLNDFIYNIKKLSMAKEMNEQAKFYFENTSKVQKAVQTQDEAYKHIINQVTIAGQKLNLPIDGNSYYYRCLWDKKSTAYYTIDVNKLLQPEHQLLIILELYKEAIAKDNELKSLLRDNTFYQNLYKDGPRTAYYVHFATKTYNLQIDDIGYLSEIIVQKIQNDFQPVMEIILNHLNP